MWREVGGALAVIFAHCWLVVRLVGRDLVYCLVVQVIGLAGEAVHIGVHSVSRSGNGLHPHSRSQHVGITTLSLTVPQLLLDSHLLETCPHEGQMNFFSKLGYFQNGHQA